MPKILISAGEASGEMYGAQLMEALRRHDSSLEFFGAGGDRMRAAGCKTVIDAKDLAVVGITEILSHLPKIWGLFNRLIAEADAQPPELAIVIDSPAFNWRVAQRDAGPLHPGGVLRVSAILGLAAGTSASAKKICQQSIGDLSFEVKFYRDRGVDTMFVGHPLADLARRSILRETSMPTPICWMPQKPGSP